MKTFLVIVLALVLSLPCSVFCIGTFQDDTTKVTPQEPEKQEPEIHEEEKEDWEKDEYEIDENKPEKEDDFDWGDDTNPMRYYKEKYEADYDAAFQFVFKAIKKTITDDLDCMIMKQVYSPTPEGLYKGIIKSDFCLFTQGKDTTYDLLKKYSKDIPFIRGGVWINGRMQYKIRLTENQDGTVHMEMESEMSGFEEYITYQVHFWKSNGQLEHQFLGRINKNLKIVRKEGLGEEDMPAEGSSENK